MTESSRLRAGSRVVSKQREPRVTTGRFSSETTVRRRSKLPLSPLPPRTVAFPNAVNDEFIWRRAQRQQQQHDHGAKNVDRGRGMSHHMSSLLSRIFELDYNTSASKVVMSRSGSSCPPTRGSATRQKRDLLTTHLVSLVCIYPPTSPTDATHTPSL